MFSIRKINFLPLATWNRTYYGEIGKYFKIQNSILTYKSSSGGEDELLTNSRLLKHVFSSNSGLTITYRHVVPVEYFTFDGKRYSIQNSSRWICALVDSRGGCYYSHGDNGLLYKHKFLEDIDAEHMVLRIYTEVIGLDLDDHLYVFDSKRLFQIKYGVIKNRIKLYTKYVEFHLIRNGDILCLDITEDFYLITKDLRVNEIKLQVGDSSTIPYKKNSFFVRNYIVEYNDWSIKTHCNFLETERRIIRLLFTLWHFCNPFNKLPRDMIFLICEYVMSLNE